MSKTIDERVVEMRFDNKDFESNVKQSMSTLDKLKQALKFPSSSSKSSMSAVANSVKTASSNMNGLNSAVSTVRASFSALDVVAVTALGNITNGVVNATKNLVKSFTIDPITSGLHEYELQMNSIQTILANTKSKGTTIDDVTKALDELNEYADLTIYNFAEMTKNIGTFTAAGVDLDTSVGAIKGIANLGAMSSSTSAQVNTAMYQLSQALATGRVSLMDWNSVVNAGMGGEQFQNALKRTAENMGKDVDGLIKKYGSFRESLTSGGWLTADVLKETLNQIGGAYDEAELRAKGYSEENIKAILDLAETATNAATEVKTFTQLMDTLHEAAGSGWAKTWQLIFGDFYESKDFFSGLHKMLEPIVTGPIDAMNSVIEKAMGGGGESRWGEFETKLKNAGTSAKEFQTELAKVYKASGKGSLNDLVKEYGSLEKAMASGKITSEEVTKALSQLSTEAEKSSKTINDSGKSLSEWQSIVDDVWRGDYGNIDTGRIEKLTKAGWEYADVQKLVNMTVDGHKLTLEDLTEAQIISMGYTKKQAKALKELADEASAAGKPMNELIDDILAPKKSGRELFLEGLENILTAILTPLKAVGKAFNDVFGIDAKGLYSIIEGFNKFSKSLIMSEDNAKRLEAVMRGVFSVFHLLASLVSTGVTAAFSAVNFVLDLFGEDFMKIAAFIGNAVYAVEQWLTVGGALSNFFERISSVVSKALTPLKEFWDSLMPQGMASEITNPIQLIITAYESFMSYIDSFAGLDPGEFFEKLANDIKTAYETIKANLTWESILEKLTEFRETFGEIFKNLVEKVKEIGPDIITGLLNGLSEGAGMAWTKMQEIGNAIISAICSVLGIHSPSTVMYEIGRNIVQGLINGIKSLIGGVTDAFSSIGVDIQEVFSNIDWGAVAMVGTGIGAFVVLYQFTDALQTFSTAAKQFTAPAQSTANLITEVTTTVKGFNQTLGFSTNTSSKGLLNIANSIKVFAEAIAILAAAVAVLAVLDTGQMWSAVGAISVLIIVLGGVTAAVNKIVESASLADVAQLSVMLLSVAGAFTLISIASYIISGVDNSGFAKAIILLTTLAGVVSALVLVNKIGKPVLINQSISTLKQVGTAFLLLAVTAKLLGGLTGDEMRNAITMILTFTVVVGYLTRVAKLGRGKLATSLDCIAQVGICFLLLAAVAKILGGMSGTEMGKAIVMLGTFTIVVGLLTAISKIGQGKDVDNVAIFLGKIGICFLLLAATARLIGGMSFEQMGRAAVGLVGLTAIIGALVALTNLIPQGKIAGISGALLSMSLSIGILGGIAVLLGYVEPEKMERGLQAVAILGLIVSAMAQSARGVRDAKGTMIGMAVIVGVLAASLAILSFIEPEKLYSAAIAMASAIGALGFAMNSVSKIGEGVKLGPIIMMAFIIAALGGILYVLASLPAESSIASAIALSSCLVAMAAAMRLLDNVTVSATSILPGMAILTVVMGALGYILNQVAGLDPVGSVANAAALSTLLLTLTASMRLLSGVKDVSTTAMVSIMLLTVVMGALGSILNQVAGLDPAGSIPNAIALSALLVALSAALVILSKVGAGAAAAQAAIIPLMELMGALTIIVGVIGAIGTIVDPAIFETAIEVMGSIGSAIGNFVGSIIGGIGEGITNSLVTMADNLSAFIEHLQPFLDGVEKIDPASFEGLASLAGAVTALTGSNILQSLAEFFGFGDSLSNFADAMEPLGEALTAFGEATSGIDPAMTALSAAAVKSLVTAMASMPNSGGMLDGLFGKKDYSGFADGMTDIGDALASFYTATEDVKVAGLNEKITGLKNLMSAMQGVPSEGGILGALIGGKDYTKFAEGMTSIGDALTKFHQSTEDIEIENLNERITAAKMLIEAMSGIEATGGLIEKLIGGTNFSAFADGMNYIGIGLGLFYQSTREIDDVTRLNGAIDATKSLIEGMAGIKSTGGLIETLIGGTNFSSFADGMQYIGIGLGLFWQSVQNIKDPEQLNSVIGSTKTLIESMSQIEPSGGLLDTLLGGETDFGGFADAMVDIGSAMKTLGEISGGVSDPEALTSLVANVKYLLSGLSGIELNTDGLLSLMMDGTTFAYLGTSLSSLGYAMRTFAENIGETSFTNITPCVTAMNGLFEFLNGLKEVDTDAVADFKAAIEDLSEIDVSEALDGFEGAAEKASEIGGSIIESIAEAISVENTSSISDTLRTVLSSALNGLTPQAEQFKTVGEIIMTSLNKGITDNDDAIGRNIGSALSNANTVASGYRGDFYSTGLYITEGLAAGISDGASGVISAAISVASQAISAAKAELDINSPSKVFRTIGKGIPEGFVQGIGMMSKEVHDSSVAMARNAYDGTRTALASVASLMESDMNFNPTISPVLDLDNVRSGAATLNSLFTDPGLEMSGFLNTTGRLIDARIQNGSFDDVVKAVDKVRGKLGDLERPSYTVNGVTYDDGSNVASAVDSLTRAIRIGRRV